MYSRSACAIGVIHRLCKTQSLTCRRHYRVLMHQMILDIEPTNNHPSIEQVSESTDGRSRHIDRKASRNMLMTDAEQIVSLGYEVGRSDALQVNRCDRRKPNDQHWAAALQLPR